ncbi:MAG: hypothetical protein GX439_08255, partial [Bacteroidales bacterium]|nr:hypothetical protein [Bacteroidales bacterium]
MERKVHFKKFLLLNLLLVLCLPEAFAQKTVSGRVTDAETGETLPGV